MWRGMVGLVVVYLVSECECECVCVCMCACTCGLHTS